MTKSLDPFRFLLIAVCGWMNQQQLQLIDYLREENRVLREQFGQRRLRFNDEQRRRLAARAKGLGKQASPRGGYELGRKQRIAIMDQVALAIQLARLYRPEHTNK